MNGARVKPEGLADAVNDILKQYDAEIVKGTNAAVEKRTKELLRAVKDNAPEDSGKYKKHLASKTVRESPRGIVKAVYARAPSYRLTHLLEYGHALHQGGRAKAKPHFAPACAAVLPKVEKDVKEVVERASH